jgi:transcriptional regulator with XRE-family HTH domain
VGRRRSGPPTTRHDGQRRAFGDRLRRLRREAKLTQRELAARAQISQSRISEWETGGVTPEKASIEALADALGVSPAARAELLDHLAQLHVEVSTWRVLHRAGMRSHQDRYGSMEQSSSEIREWSGSTVPGLLQTSDYVRTMCETWDVPGLVDVDGIVAGREHRQEILAERTKRFQFLMGESALRCRDIPAEVMAEQIDRILLLAAMRHIEVGIVPRDVMVPAATGFDVFDDRLVLIDLDTTEVIIRDPDQVARYLDIYERLRVRAVRGADLADLVRTIAHDLRRTQ